jgi:hypothetical protein
VKAKILLTVLFAAVLVAGTANAGFISILGEDGKAFNLDTSSGVASFAAQLQNPLGSKEEWFSPNALGVSGGSYFYATFNTPGNEGFYRDNTLLTTIGAGDPYNIANGDAVGSNFYFVDRNTGAFNTVSGIFGPGTPTVSTGAVISGAADTMGDLAISGNTGYLSYDGKLSTFDITNPGGGITTVTQNRFVGLGFDGDNLFGVLRVGENNFDLYSINTTTLATIKVADITGIPTTGGGINNNGSYEITDAARAVPIPAAAWLLGTGIVGLVALKRRNQK